MILLDRRLLPTLVCIMLESGANRRWPVSISGGKEMARGISKEDTLAVMVREGYEMTEKGLVFESRRGQRVGGRRVSGLVAERAMQTAEKPRDRRIESRGSQWTGDTETD